MKSFITSGPDLGQTKIWTSNFGKNKFQIKQYGKLCSSEQIFGKLGRCERFLTHLSQVSFLLDIGKQGSPRSDTAERGI